MARKFSPEFIIAGYFKSATGGRELRPLYRRILTIVIIPIWLCGFAWVSYMCYDGIMAEQYYQIHTHSYDAIYYGSFGYMPEPRLVLDRFVFPALYYLFFCYIGPWAIMRLVFWVVDADKAK